MILEPYRIEILDLEKDSCAFLHDIVRVNNNTYYKLISGTCTFTKGHFIGTRSDRAEDLEKFLLGDLENFLLGRASMCYGRFVRVRDTLFLEEESTNYYA